MIIKWLCEQFFMNIWGTAIVRSISEIEKFIEFIDGVISRKFIEMGKIQNTVLSNCGHLECSEVIQ